MKRITKKDTVLNFPKGEKFVMPTNEIIGSIAADKYSEEDIRNFFTNSAEELYAKFNVNIFNGFDVSIVHNTDKVVHLVLPCYESFEGTTVEFIDDANLEAFGGEFFFIILPAILIGAKIASVLGATVGTAVVGGVTITGATIGASAGVIAAGAVAGGAIGTAVAAGVAGVAVGAAHGAGHDINAPIEGRK